MDDLFVIPLPDLARLSEALGTPRTPSGWIKKFQEKRGLVQDGILGPQTCAAMREETCK